jgi:hypothetical protein
LFIRLPPSGAQNSGWRGAVQLKAARVFAAGRWAAEVVVSCGLAGSFWHWLSASAAAFGLAVQPAEIGG